MKITVLDTTLRDGTQGELVSFGVDEKLKIARRLDDFGVSYIEGGWPSSNPQDVEFFRRAKALTFKNSKLVAFGFVRHKNRPVHEDPQVAAALDADTPVVAVCANCVEVREDSWILERTAETIRFFAERGREVLFDAQNFFDVYPAHPAQCLRLLETAREAGASVLVLCDTSGGAVTEYLEAVCGEVRKQLPEAVLGIHTHNDMGLAVANTLAAVQQGFSHVQGCVNGYGERCGNADLCSVIANLELKLGHETVGRDKLHDLSGLARFVAEMAQLPLRSDQPYVGRSAFIQLPIKESEAHVRPEDVGNHARTIWPIAPDTDAVTKKVEETGLAAGISEPALRELVERVRQLELEGYDLEPADGTFELLVRDARKPGQQFFLPSSMEITTRTVGVHHTQTTATVSIEAKGAALFATTEGDGPIHALDTALRQCLSSVFPQILPLRLVNYQIRVLEPHKGTAARGRVLIEWASPLGDFATVGVSENILNASWLAMLDAVRLELLRAADLSPALAESIRDASWAV
jgi:2-isopropylmalate synthase